MRFVFLHHHILKNAGSTIEDILDRSFGDRFARLETPRPDGTIRAAETLSFVQQNPGLLALSSHQIRYPLPHDPNILFFDICFLRDPFDRVRSMYDYFRSRPVPGDGPSDLANRSTLGQFVRGMVEDFPLHVRDVQVNLIAAAGDSNEPTLHDLKTATERIVKASFPGVVDLFQESVISGQYFLGHVHPELDCAQPPSNVSGGLGSTLESRVEKLREACEPAVFEKLAAVNQLDLKLLEAARKEVRRRLALVSDSTTLRRREATPTPIAPSNGRLRTLAARCRLLGPDALTPGRRAPRELFDAEFYVAKYPDVKQAGIDPLVHYILHGSFEGRKPHPWFQPDYYLSQCPEAGCGNGNPLVHFLTTGWQGLANPHRLFDCRAWLRDHPEVAAARLNPLVHYLESTGKSEKTSDRTGLNIDDAAVPFSIAQEPCDGMQFEAPAAASPFIQSLNQDQLRALT